MLDYGYLLAPQQPSMDIRRLVATAKLSVVYQPIVDVESQTVIGYEALGRPPNGWDGPGALLDAAHASGCLLALDRRWRMLAIDGFRDVPAPVRCFLNVDGRVANDVLFAPGFTSARIEEAGLSPDRFVLELTESNGPTSPTLERTLVHYAEQGFTIALDDVGAAGQSLDRVLRVRPSILKIDGPIVRAMRDDPAAREIVRSLVDVGRRLGASVIAEGIESEQDLVAAVRAGVHAVQGFYLGRPAERPQALDESVRARLREATRARRHGRATVNEVEAEMLSLLGELTKASDLETALSVVTAGVVRSLGTERASVRLLDASREGLLVAARTGVALHTGTDARFAVGEGLVGWVVAQNRALRVGSARDDARYAPRGDIRSAFASFLGVPLTDADGCFGVLATTSQHRDAFDESDETRARLLAALASPLLLVHRLQRLAQTDPLTSVLNRHALDHVLPDSAGTIAVAILDVDHFKGVNDRHGHAVGDQVLRDIARELRANVRTDDHIVRLGGEEFLLVLPNASLEVAKDTAERIRQSIHASVRAAGDSVTVSIGVGTRQAGERRDALLARVDAALYAAKRAGRDRVLSLPPPFPTDETL